MLDWIGDNFVLIGMVLLPALSLLFFVVQFLGGLEKKHLPSFVPLDAQVDPRLSPYARVVNEDAATTGFRSYGTRRKLNEATAKGYGTAWLSPDGGRMAVVIWGSLGIKRTVFVSRLQNDTWLVSCDEYGKHEPSPCVQFEVLMNADWRELNEFQEQRLANADFHPVVLTTEDAWEAYVEMERAAAQCLADHGYARFVDAERTAWKYTFRGALRLAWGSRLGKHVKQMRARSKIKRPGDRGYSSSATRDALLSPPAQGDADQIGPEPVDRYAESTEYVRAVVRVGHSRCGIASLVLAPLLTITYIAVFVWTATYEEDPEEFPWPGLVILLAMLGMVAGLALGLVGLTQRRRKRVLAVVGLVANGLLLCLVVGLLALGILLNAM